MAKPTGSWWESGSLLIISLSSTVDYDWSSKSDFTLPDPGCWRNGDKTVGRRGGEGSRSGHVVQILSD